MTKIIFVVSVFILTLGNLDTRAGSDTAYFRYYQQIETYSPTWSYVLIYNHNTGSYAESDWVYGNATFSYTVPYWSWKSFWLFDALGQADEAYHFYDEDM